MKIPSRFSPAAPLALLGLVAASGTPAQAGEDTARLQVIHNAADPAAATVDIYFGDDRAIDDFAFRDATEFLTVPAGVSIPVGVAPGDAPNSDGIIRTIPVMFEAGETYVAIANGVLDPAQFQGNPDFRGIDFTLFSTDGVREGALDGSLVDFIGVHGATDAPTVDIIARGVGTLLDDVAYGDISDYLSVPAAKFILDVTPGNDNDTVVASFEADLTGLDGGAAVVFASGFLTPEDDQNGLGFGLFAALPNGAVAEFPLLTTARVQVIHNAADPGAALVDIYLNEDRALNDFAFRDATPFIDFPANQVVNIGVAGPNSNDFEDALRNVPVNLLAGESYVVVANGVLEAGDFAPNPDGRAIDFGLLVKSGAREVGSDPKNVDLVVLHGATDAPAVQVRAVPGGLIVPQAAYGDFTDYLTVPATRYNLFVRRADEQRGFLKGFLADVTGLEGNALTVFASGFITPGENQDGESFGLLAVTAGGDVIELPLRNPFVSIRTFDPAKPGVKSPAKAALSVDPFQNEVGLALAQNAPNPFRGATSIAFQLPSADRVSLKVFDLSGREVATVLDQELGAGVHNVDYSDELSSGIYYYELRTSDAREVRKMTVFR